MCISCNSMHRRLCRLEGGHLTCCQVERTLSQRRISCSGARRGTLAAAQQVETAATAAQRELEMHAEMHNLEMQLQELEELKAQLSRACRRVHTANARPRAPCPPIGHAWAAPWPTPACTGCSHEAQGPEGGAAVGTVRVGCTCARGRRLEPCASTGANSTMSNQCSVNAKLLRDLTNKLGLSEQLLQPALDEVAHLRRESAARAAQVKQLEAALAREAQQRLSLAKLALNAHTHLERAGLAAAALNSACEVTPVSEPLGAAVWSVAAHVESGLGALATDLLPLFGGAPRGATAVEQLRVLSQDSSPSPSLSSPGRAARSQTQASAQPSHMPLGGLGHAWVPPHESSPFSPRAPWRGFACHSSPAITVSPRSPLVTVRPSFGADTAILHGPARRALEQKQPLQPVGSALAQEARPTSVGTQWAQAGGLKTLPPDRSARGSLRGAVPLVAPLPLLCSSSPSVQWPLGDASRSVSTLTKGDGAFGPAHSAAAHRVDSSAAHCVDSLASLGARGPAASSRARAEAKAEAQEQFRPKAMVGMGAFSIHRPKMKAPPTLSSAFDGQGHRAPRE